MPAKGEVVTVPIYFTDRPKFIVRPAVVISSDVFHTSRRDIIVAAITSNVNRQGFGGYLVLNDWKASGLIMPSAISGIIMTLRDSQVLQVLGRLSDGDFAAMNNVLRAALDL